MLISTSSPSPNVRNPKARILTIGSYLPALKTWHMLLEAHGYVAVSFVLNNGSGDLFRQGPFDVVLLGQSVDDGEKKSLVEACRKYSSAPIISVPSTATPIDGADIHAEPDPEQLLKLIANLVQRKQSRMTAQV